MRCSELSSPPPQRSEGSKTEGDRVEEEEGVQFLYTEERETTRSPSSETKAGSG